MSYKRLLASWAAIFALTISSSALSQDLPQQAYGLLKKHCYRCHGEEFNGNAALNVIDRAALLGGEHKYVVPGKPDDSYIWQRMGLEGDMPPDGPKPSKEEIALLKRWIEAGAEFPLDASRRAFVSERDMLSAILADMRDLDEFVLPYQRYFTITHLYNNPKVNQYDLRLYRAALSKAINSLSWEPDIVVPAAVDEAQTIFRVDLRSLGWVKRGLWQKLLKANPYGRTFDNHDDPEIRNLFKQIGQFSGTDLPYVRADWFVVTATQPPLYHELLDLPKTSNKLEERLGVDFEHNYFHDRLARAGFPKSGVSSQNRLVERHPALFGAYWASYDFAPNGKEGNLFNLPLGPKFASNPHARQAFAHDGGEIIFDLPNGLQGYLLVNAKGERIDEGPEKIVSSKLKTLGGPTIVNGISCMHCHRHGMIGFKDEVRLGAGVFGKARLKVERLYPAPEGMNRLLKKDENRYLAALEQAAGPFLQVGEDKGKPIRSFAEPVGAIAKYYIRDLGPQEAACELGIESAEGLQLAVKTNKQLVALGLRSLSSGGVVKRAAWESRENVFSPFQQAAGQLGQGAPLVIQE